MDSTKPGVADDGRVDVSYDGHVASVMISRKSRRNALNVALTVALAEALAAVEANEEVRVVVLRGATPAFCAGADFGDFGSGSDRGGFVPRFAELLDRIAHLRVPVIAAVEGPAIGAGCQILIQCDLSVAAESSKIGITGARIGLMLDMANINRLVCEVGPSAARRLLLTGDLIEACEAMQLGLINRVVPDGEAVVNATDWAHSIAERAPLSVQGHKTAIQSVVDGWWLPVESPAYEANRRRAVDAFGSDDLQEGLSAFAGRRDPRFVGR